MSRRVFFSFHHDLDASRAAQLRSMGVVHANEPLSEGDWEQMANAGDKAVRKWIDEQIRNKTCVVVLIGEQTAHRKWIEYEINAGWQQGKGLLGIHVHGLRNLEGQQARKGPTPFSTLQGHHLLLPQVAKAYDPPFFKSHEIYGYIEDNLADWVEEAVSIRARYQIVGAAQRVGRLGRQ